MFTMALASSLFLNSDAGDWYVLHVRSRQEKALAADLAARQIACFLPLAPTVRCVGRRKEAMLCPVFPGYLFLRGSREQTFLADRTRRVCQILPVADQAGLERELLALHTALETGAVLTPCPFMAVGTAVEVVAGPFKGVCGLVQEHRAVSRLILQITTLGQATSLEIDASLLVPVSRPALGRAG